MYEKYSIQDIDNIEKRLHGSLVVITKVYNDMVNFNINSNSSKQKTLL